VAPPAIPGGSTLAITAILTTIRNVGTPTERLVFV
jgi:hypothetical protein